MGYYNRNLETDKLELHFDKAEYMALSDDQKKEIKSNFLFSRNSGAWISRCKFPRLHWAEKVAIDLGLTKEEDTGDKLTFAEKMERKAERAENRADYYDYKSAKATATGEALQKPINDMHGDISFFTQPNINTSAGRAFTRKRNRMWESWEKGMQEFRKSEYYADRAESARQTAKTATAPDKAFCQRRIDEAMASIRKLTKSIEEYQGYMSKIEAGEEVTNKYGWKVEITPESIISNIERWEEIRDDEISKAAYYDALIQEAGGVAFSKDNIKPGYLVRLSKSWQGIVLVAGTGPKNMKYRNADGTGFTLTASYAEIREIVSDKVQDVKIPFEVGEELTIKEWNGKDYAPKTYKITKIDGVKVTLKSGSERAINRKARTSYGNKNEWILPITDGHNGYIARLTT